jgi:hypothetical protein
MNLNRLRSQRGFGLVAVLAALIIVTVSIGGLFIVSALARQKVHESYHYRAVLLGVSGKMEYIKFHNRNISGTTNIENLPVSFYDPIVIDRHDSRTPLTAKLGRYSPSRRIRSDLQIDLTVVYDEITLTYEWEEPPAVPIFSHQTGEEKRITLREDYYRKTQQEIE